MGGDDAQQLLSNVPVDAIFAVDASKSVLTEDTAALHGDHMGMASLGWVSGCLVIWSSLFAIGNFLYGRTQPALILTGVFIVSGIALLYVINHLWDKKDPAK
jgi:hypothetical protein